jgi:hypothetical protein
VMGLHTECAIGECCESGPGAMWQSPSGQQVVRTYGPMLVGVTGVVISGSQWGAGPVMLCWPSS